jgi:hypothetical protein
LADTKALGSRDLESPYVSNSGRSFYDIGSPDTDPFPPSYFLGYLNQAWVQQALGVPVNFTMSSETVFDAFNGVGDMVRGGLMDDLAFLLESNVKVTLVYGDRDFACNWIGGENVSLNIPWSQQQNFAGAGYADLRVNDSYVGGLVRQYGNLSFARVYQAGHEVPAYQPQTAYEIFRRSMNNLDIATGNIHTAGGGYSTLGPADAWGVRMPAPAPLPNECYVLAPNTCTDDELQSILEGSAKVHNYLLTGPKSSDGHGVRPTARKMRIVSTILVATGAALLF